MHIDYENFDWSNYINLNEDLKLIINTKKNAWEHWLNHGKEEERPLFLLNNTSIHHGRFGNLFFINMAMHFISLKFNLKCNYKYFNKFEKLGIHLHIGKNFYDNNLTLTDDNFLDIIQNETNKSNIIINNENWFQTDKFTLFLKVYFSIPYNKFKIINSNNYFKRYNNNNDLFIHMRIGDVANRTDNIKAYYEKVLSSINFTTGYISSDSIDNELCIYFINKYKLIIINNNEIETIMFGSTCNNIVLSGGTYSWLIGFLAFYSKNIYYPNISNPWYGNIYQHFNWNTINY